MINKKISSYFLNWKFIISISIGIFFIIITFYNLDFDQIRNNFSTINYYYFCISTLLLILTVYFRALRWNLLLKDNISNNFLFELQFISYFGNNIFPLKFGEFIKTYLLSKKYNSSKSFILGTVILEKFLDCIGMMILAFIIFYYNLFNISEYKYIVIIISILSILGVCISYYFNRSKNIKKNTLMKIVHQVIDGFSTINKANILLCLLYTCIIWSIYIYMIGLIFLSMNIYLSFSKCIIILFLTTIPFLIPSTPANIGIFEFLVTTALIPVLVISPERAAVIAVILHLSTFVPYTIIGGYYFTKNYLFNIS